MCDGETYNAPAVADEDQKGTLFSEGQLVFDGTGTLNITKEYAVATSTSFRLQRMVSTQMKSSL